MTGLLALWLPIIVAAAIVFLASSVIHMAPLWHKGDYPAMPNADAVATALRPLAIPPGDYMLPHPVGAEEMKSPEFAERVLQGPNLIVTVLPNERWSMGRNLSLWFLYCLVVSIFAAYVTVHAVATSAMYGEIFRLAFTTAFIGYSVALWQMSIWYRRAWSTTIKATLDGVIYALLTAVAFGWMWPR